MEEPSDKSVETTSAPGKQKVHRSDLCDAFKQDEDRLFFYRECWYCKFADFGIFTEHPMEIGICKYGA